MSLLCASQLTLRPISVEASELVYLRHLLEASEGLGFVVGARGGAVFLATMPELEQQLDRFILDMKGELSIEEGMTDAHRKVLSEF